MINKTTFYSHYETIEALNNQVCSELIVKILDHCPHINGIFTDTNAFVNEIHNIFLKNGKIILNLYDNDINALVNDIESELFKSYISNDVNVDMMLAIRFCIGGAFRFLVMSQSEEYVEKTVFFIERFVDSLGLSQTDSL